MTPSIPFEHWKTEHSEPEREPYSYRFGPFEVLVQSGVLLRRGDRIRIEDLPLRMLVVLLERPRRLVLREELRARLWGENTYGASDNRLNVAAAKLREALYDTTGEGPYIETVRGKGYLLAADVQAHRSTTAEEPKPSQPEAAVGQEIPVPPKAVPMVSRPLVFPSPVLVTAEEAPPNKRQFWFAGGGPITERRRIAMLALASAAAVVAVILLSLIWGHGRLLISPQDKVMIGRFVNQTGEDAFSGMMQPALRYKLEESPYLSFVSSSALRSQLKDLNSASIAEELRACQALGGKIMVDGEIASANPGYELRVNARRCADGRILASEKAEAAGQAQTLTGLGEIIQRMRGRLGETPASLQRFNVPLAQATTASLAALKAFSDGEQKRALGEETEAISDYQLSVDLDPQFALAYARMGTIYDNLGEHLLSRQNYQKAFDLRERTTDRERLYITSHYYSAATGEIDRAIQAQQLWRTLYPRDMTPANNLAIEYLALGQMDKAIEAAKVARSLDNSSEIAYATLAAAYLRSGNYDALAPFCTHASAVANFPPTHNTCFLLAFVRGDKGAMQAELTWARSNPAGSELIEEAAWSAAYGGEMKRSHTLFAEAKEIGLANGLKEFAAQVEADEADIAADLGDRARATKLALDALQLAPTSQQVRVYAALALARSGNLARAQSEAAKAAAQAPKDTILQSVQLASIKAAIALEQHNPADAIHALEETEPYDLSSAMSLAPAYYRGLALLQSHRPAEASREFGKVVAHRTLAPDSIYVALAYAELGRTFQEMGDQKHAAGAAAQTQTIWKHADPDFPLLHDSHKL